MIFAFKKCGVKTEPDYEIICCDAEWQRREKVAEGFTKKYDVRYLVRHENHGSAEAAITREKQIKKWSVNGR